MIHLHAGMTGTTRDGSQFEIFAERDGMFYGRVYGWPVKWSGSGVALDHRGDDWDILPPAPVKKWRWVMRAYQMESPLGFSSVYRETQKHYATAKEAEADFDTPTVKAIARIEGSEVEET